MIGILTFHRAVNYGAVLQCYALQTVLNQMGVENEVVDYRCSFIEKRYALKPSVSPIHVKHFLAEVKTMPKRKAARNAFDLFLTNNIALSRIYYKENIESCCERYKGIITGSDQVWNLSITGEDTTYALDFVNGKTRKLSYAASIGPKSIRKDYENKLLQCLQSYDILSVREPAAVDTVSRMADKLVHVDVDPTILPDISVWNVLAHRSEMKEKDFIFMYIMQPSDVLYDTAVALAKQNNLKIFTISMVNDKRKIGKDMQGASIEDFLWMVKNASYIITNSFHGIMFALRFHKQFYWAYQQGSHMSNSRFDMLVEQYGIDKRCCRDNESYKECSFLDFDDIEQIMFHQREQSIANLLRYILGE